MPSTFCFKGFSHPECHPPHCVLRYAHRRPDDHRTARSVRHCVLHCFNARTMQDQSCNPAPIEFQPIREWIYQHPWGKAARYDQGKPTLLMHPSAVSALRAAARDISPVEGYTHNFYRYPARFSPVFVRQTIETLTNPGDLVIDPFVGGGTTVVEALALGRRRVGADISSLATFIT